MWNFKLGEKVYDDENEVVDDKIKCNKEESIGDIPCKSPERCVSAICEGTSLY